MNPSKIITSNALLITLLIGSFFFTCKLFGLEGNPYLRFANLFFVIFGVRRAIKLNILKNQETRYTTNLGIGIQTSALAVLISILGVIGYTYFIHPEFLDIMKRSFLFGGSKISLGAIFFTLLIEGMASSVIGSFIIMQFFKNHNKIIATL